MSQIFNIELNEPWFELVKEGKKIYEGRRNYGKISKVKVGDILKINKYKDFTVPEYKVKVIERYDFPTFRKAFEKIPIEQILPIDGIMIDEAVKIYYKYVSEATQQKDGVIMLKLTNQI